MKKLTLATFLLAGALAVSCNNDKAPDSETTTSAMEGDHNAHGNNDRGTNATGDNMGNNGNNGEYDSKFVMDAAEGGMFEVEAAKIAQSKATNAEVKSFAAMMIKDHTAANNELMSFASKKGITPPTTPSADMQGKLDDLREEKAGKAFDEEYMEMMVSAHKKDVDTFEDAAEDHKDAETKTWASGKLPTLKHHLDMAQKLKDKVD